MFHLRSPGPVVYFAGRAAPEAVGDVQARGAFGRCNRDMAQHS